MEISRLRKVPTPSKERPCLDSDVILHLALQAPEVLRSHLDVIFDLDINATCYYASAPWRDSGTTHFQELRQAAWSSDSLSPKKRLWAWQAMVATGDPDVLLFVAEHWPFMLATIQECYSSARKHPPSPNDYFHYGANAEWTPETNGFRSLVPEKVCYHIRFAKDHEESLSGDQRTNNHPSWNFPLPDHPAGTHGGAEGGHCILCGHPLFDILTLKQPMPDGLGITEIKENLRLATCLKCFPFEHEYLFFQHDRETGGPTPLLAGIQPTEVTFEAPPGPLRKGDIRLTPTPPRWHLQYWGNGNNMNKLGGKPNWVQDAAYPTCPECGKTMPYLAQLSDDFPGHGLWSGDSGQLYIFWCDNCKVSGFLSQCL